ncbi:MAG: hypothetical protein MJZ87_08845 [Bacteroidales bacterium]|nr:hypothetical protein [Bacteroidales bacterium]
MEFKLKIGDIIKEGKSTIVILDEASFCYKIKAERNGASGNRLISKSILEEFVKYVKLNPNCSSRDARDYLSGRSENDKYEYGYDSTYCILAKEVIRRVF